MEIITILNHVARENTYLLVNDQAIIVIDPGSNGEVILSKIEELDRPVVVILFTAVPYAHILSLDLVRNRFEHPPVYISDKEADWLYTPEMNLSGLSRHDDMENVVMSPAEETFQYDHLYRLAGFEFSVVQTPGHSWGGVSFVFHSDDFVITGDALFRESIGRTDLPTSNFNDLIVGIRNNLFTLPSHYAVYPGHGWPTTIAHEKNFNPFFQ